MTDLKKYIELLKAFIRPVLIGNAAKPSLDQINFNALLFSAAMLSVLSCIFNFIFIGDSDIPLLIFSALASLALTVLYLLSRFKNYYNLWVTLSTILLLLSIIWFLNGGTIGSISYIYLITIAVFIIIARRSQQNLIFVLFLLNILCLYFLEYFLGNRLVHPYANGYTQYSDMVFVFMLVLFCIFFLIRFIKRAYDNERAKVVLQKGIIEEQNREMLASITYASNLQKKIISDEAHLGLLFSEYFVLFKPKDIVSGDFYWVKEKGKYSIVVAADCTGHGVPAAFLSILGISILEEIVQQEDEELHANDLLEKLRSRFIPFLKKNEQGTEYAKDGIEAGICVINYEDNSFQFSGAHRQLIMVRNNELPEPSGYYEKSSSGTHSLYAFKGTKNTIGFNYKHTDFINYTIDFHLKDTFYIFSDGYGDQFNAQNKKKFMTGQMKKEFLKMSDLPMSFQKKRLNDILEIWKGGTSQTDDILVIGLRM